MTIKALRTLNLITLTMASVLGIRHSSITIYPRYVEGTLIQRCGTIIHPWLIDINVSLSECYIMARHTLKNNMRSVQSRDSFEYIQGTSRFVNPIKSIPAGAYLPDYQGYTHRAGLLHAISGTSLTSLCRTITNDQLVDQSAMVISLKPEYLYQREGLIRNREKHYISNPNNLLEEKHVLGILNIESGVYTKGNN